MQNEELTITAGDDHPATQNAYSIHQAKPEDLPIAFPLRCLSTTKLGEYREDSETDQSVYLACPGGA